MIHIRDEEAQRLHLDGDARPIADMSEEVTQCVMAACTVPTTVA
jgi:hypothetical protein